MLVQVELCQLSHNLSRTFGDVFLITQDIVHFAEELVLY